MNAGVYGLLKDANFYLSRSKKIALKGLPLVAQATNFCLEFKEREQILFMRYYVNVT
jgi:hypothetical protein